ncbi:MAG: glucarate dehydratase [Ignavibacteria bacterium]|nr:glucarate dehydratase [Ignavibacteria bacterium]
MKITAIRPRVVAIPIEAPTRHSYGSPTHFTRTIVEISTDEQITGLGETHNTVSPSALEGLQHLLLGEDPFDLEKIRLRISQRGYLSREPLLLAPIEFACYDIQGRSVGRPVYQLLGGKVRERVPMSAYLFYRYPNTEGWGEISTPDQMVEHCQDLVNRYGFKTLKLKGGVFDPELEFATIIALRKRFGSEYKIRLDPNAIWSVATAIRMGLKLVPYDLEYYEDPAWGIAGLARVRQQVPIPLSTNMSVIEFEQLGPAVETKAIDTILSDPWYWGGMYYTKVLDMAAKHLGLSVGMHSGVEFGVGLSVMLHVASSMPNLVHAIDSHYHHLKDDILKGGKLQYARGSMSPRDLPGLGIELDEEKMAVYGEEYRRLAEGKSGSVPDPRRPDWYPIVPSW